MARKEGIYISVPLSDIFPARTHVELCIPYETLLWKLHKEYKTSHVLTTNQTKHQHMIHRECQSSVTKHKPNKEDRTLTGCSYYNTTKITCFYPSLP